MSTIRIRYSCGGGSGGNISSNNIGLIGKEKKEKNYLSYSFVNIPLAVEPKVKN